MKCTVSHRKYKMHLCSEQAGTYLNSISGVKQCSSVRNDISLPWRLHLNLPVYTCKREVFSAATFSICPFDESPSGANTLRADISRTDALPYLLPKVAPAEGTSTCIATNNRPDVTSLYDIESGNE